MPTDVSDILADYRRTSESQSATTDVSDILEEHRQLVAQPEPQTNVQDILAQPTIGTGTDVSDILDEFRKTAGTEPHPALAMPAEFSKRAGLDIKGAVKTFGRELGYGIVPSTAAALAMAGTGLAGIATGPLDIALMAGAGAGAAYGGEKLQEKVLRAKLGDEGYAAFQAERAAGREAHPIAANMGYLIPMLIGSKGMGGVRVAKAVAPRTVRALGEKAAAEAVAAGIPKKTVDIIRQIPISRYAETLPGRLKTGLAAGTAFAGIGAGEELAQGVPVGTVAAQIPGNILAMGATGLFPVAKTVLRSIGKGVTDAGAMAVVNATYNDALYKVSTGKQGAPWETSDVFKGSVAGTPGFTLLQLMNLALTRGRMRVLGAAGPRPVERPPIEPEIAPEAASPPVEVAEPRIVPPVAPQPPEIAPGRPIPPPEPPPAITPVPAEIGPVAPRPAPPVAAAGPVAPRLTPAQVADAAALLNAGARPETVLQAVQPVPAEPITRPVPVGAGRPPPRPAAGPPISAERPEPTITAQKPPAGAAPPAPKPGRTIAGAAPLPTATPALSVEESVSQGKPVVIPKSAAWVRATYKNGDTAIEAKSNVSVLAHTADEKRGAIVKVEAGNKSGKSAFIPSKEAIAVKPAKGQPRQQVASELAKSTLTQANNQVRRIALLGGMRMEGRFDEGPDATIRLRRKADGFFIEAAPYTGEGIGRNERVTDQQGRVVGYRVGFNADTGRMDTVPHEILGHIAADTMSPADRRALRRAFGIETKDWREVDEAFATRIGQDFVNGVEHGTAGSYLRQVWQRVKAALGHVMRLRFGNAWDEISRMPADARAERIMGETMRGERLGGTALRTEGGAREMDQVFPERWGEKTNADIRYQRTPEEEWPAAPGRAGAPTSQQEKGYIRSRERRMFDTIMRDTLGLLPKEMRKIPGQERAMRAGYEEEVRTRVEDTRAALESEFKDAAARNSARQRLLDYWERRAPLASVGGADLRQKAESFRSYLDERSQQAIDEDMLSPAMKETWRANKGEWLKRGYEIFSEGARNFDEMERLKNRGDPDATRRWNSVASFLRQQDPARTPQDIRDIMRGLRDRTETEGAMTGESPLPGTGSNVRIAISSLMRRKDLPLPVRQWMGEITDPFAKALQSGKWMSQFISRSQAQRDFVSLGLDLGFISDKMEGKNTVEMYANEPDVAYKRDPITGEIMKTEEGEPIAQPLTRVDMPHRELRGKWVSPDMEKAVSEFMDQRNPSRENMEWAVVNAWKRFVGVTKAAKVPYNPGSWGVNVLGGGFMRLFDGGLRHIRDAYDSVFMGRRPMASVPSAREARARSLHLLGARTGTLGGGIFSRDVDASLKREPVGDTTAASFRKIKDSTMQVLSDPKNKGAYRDIARAVGDLLGRPGELFIRKPDDVNRMDALLDKLELSRNAFPNRTDAEHLLWAAERASNVYQTYDRLPAFVRQLSTFGAFNTFVSFKVELLRNVYWMGRYIREDIKSGNAVLAKDAYRRLVYMASVGALPVAVAAMTKSAAGVSDDEEDALRNSALPPWDRDEMLGYVGKEGSRYRYFAMSYLIPHAEFVKILKAGYRSIDVEHNPDGLKQLLTGVASDYLGPGAAAGPLIETIANKRIGLGPVTMREGAAGAADRANYAFRATVMPMAAQYVADTYRGLFQPRGDYGKVYAPSDPLLKMAAIRVRNLDVNQQVPHRLSGLTRRWQDASAYYNNMKRKTDDPDRLREAARYTVETQNKLRQEYQRVKADLVKLGVNPGQLYRAEKTMPILLRRNIPSYKLEREAEEPLRAAHPPPAPVPKVKSRTLTWDEFKSKFQLGGNLLPPS